MWIKQHGAQCVLIFVLALAVRVLYLHQIHDVPLFDQPTSDASIYCQMALEIAGLAPGAPAYYLRDEAFFYPPLYPHLLAGLFYLFGNNLLIPRILQAVLGALICVQVFSIGRRVFSPAAGLVAGLAACFYWVFLYFDGELLATTLSIFLNLCVLQLLLRAMRTDKLALFLAAGAALGLAALARPTVLAFGAVFAGALLLFPARGRRAARPAMFVLGAALIISPVAVRNHLADGSFTPICASGAINLYIGNNPRAEETIAVRPFTEWIHLWYTPERETGRAPLTAKEREDFWTGKVVSYVRTQPADFVLRKLKALALFWHSYEIKRNVDIYFFREFSWLLWTGALLSFGSVAPLALAGIALARRRFREQLPLLSFIAVHMLTVSAFFVASRYRLPVVPVLLIYGAHALVWMLSTPRKKAALACLAAVLGLAVLINTDFFGARNYDAAENRLFLAEAHIASGEAEPAVREIEAALALRPEYAEAHYLWGRLLAREGAADDALKKAEEALRLSPDHVSANLLAGLIHETRGRFQEAEASFARAAAILPKAEPHFHHGYALMQLGRHAEAEDEMRAALRLQPDYGDALFGLLDAQIKQGRIEEAKATLDAFLTVKPEAALNVGNFLAAVPGPAGEALREHLSRRVLE